MVVESCIAKTSPFDAQRCKTNAHLIQGHPNGELPRCLGCGRERSIRILKAAVEKIAGELVEQQLAAALEGRKSISKVYRRTIYGFELEIKL